MARSFSIFLVILVGFAGCGTKAPPATTPLSKVSATEAKAAVQQWANTGVVGSESELVKKYAEDLKATDAAKGDALLKDLDAVRQAGGGDRTRAKAREILGKM